MRIATALAATAAIAVTAFAPMAPAHAQALVKMMVMQADGDPESLARDNRIQKSVATEFAKVLNAPGYSRITKQYGLDGLTVYDETFTTLYSNNNVGKTRRSDPELISIVKQLPDIDMDVVLLYTLYAKAVDDPYGDFQKLQTSMNYSVYNVGDGRFLGGDTIDTDLKGIPFTGCAANINGAPADPHCVKEFVSQHANRLAADAANKVAIELASLLGGAYGSTNDAINDGGAYQGGGKADLPDVGYQAPVASADCPAAIPKTYNIRFEGMDNRQTNQVQEFMQSWACAMDVDAKDASFSATTFEYQTRADRGRVLRNLRLMTEIMGLVAEVRTEGNKGIIVSTLNLRTN